MSNPGKRIQEPGFDDSVTDRFKSLNLDDSKDNKPDFKELDLGSPCSPLRARPSGQATTSSSSSSSGSVSFRNAPSNSKPSNVRSDSAGSPLIHSSGGSVNSPSVNVLPTGNICPQVRIPKTGMASRSSTRTDTLGTGTGHYGHGSIMRGTGSSSRLGGSNSAKLGGESGSSAGGDFLKRAMSSLDPEEVKRAGNDQYKKGHFEEALNCYSRAISLSPANAAYRSNRAAALTALGRLPEAVRECEEAVRLNPSYGRAHHRLASLLLRLGQVENSRNHFYLSGPQSDPSDMQKLQSVEKHLRRCSDSRKVGDWKSALREADAAIAAGADASSQLFTCRAEALLKVHQLEDAEYGLSNVPKFEQISPSCSQGTMFGMISEAYILFVRAQIEMALGRFENAVASAEKAAQTDPRSAEISVLLKNVKLVSRARSRGNDLFKSERFTEACSAYDEGLKLDPSNSVLYCNRAACWYKLGLWERSIEDCNQALHIQPNYTKALLRRASSNTKLERWEAAVRDYEVLRRQLPDDNEVAESLFHAQVALKKSRGEEVYNMKFGGDVEVVSGLDQFRAAVSSPGVCVVFFKAASDQQCEQISPFVDSLCARYPSVNFLKVDVEESSEVAKTENVRIVPTFKIYKNGNRVKEMICPTTQVLEHSVRHYSII